MRQITHIISIVSVFVLTCLCTGCSEEAPQETKDCYRLLRVKQQAFTLNRKLFTKLDSKSIVSVRPWVGGRLAKICVEEGAHVKKGQPLFIIDQAPYISAVDAAKAQVATARATLATAKLNLEGKEQLYAQKMVGEYDLHRARYAHEEALAQLEVAQAELETARINLDYTTICSPVDGVIDMQEYREGDYIEPSGKLFTLLVDNRYLNAYTIVSEQMLSELMRDFKCSSLNDLVKKLPPVTFYSSWGYKLPQKGRIDAISGNVELMVGATYLSASFYNPDEFVRSGSNGYITIPYVMHNVIIIPQEAAVDMNEKYLVYKVVNGKAVATEVTVLPYSNGRHFVVTGGLKTGDVIIAEGAGFVTDGIEITEKKGGKPL
jgi:membrane fusion protein (multidrug efflux system)